MAENNENSNKRMRINQYYQPSPRNHNESMDNEIRDFLESPTMMEAEISNEPSGIFSSSALMEDRVSNGQFDENSQNSRTNFSMDAPSELSEVPGTSAESVAFEFFDQEYIKTKGSLEKLKEHADKIKTDLKFMQESRNSSEKSEQATKGLYQIKCDQSNSLKKRIIQLEADSNKTNITLNDLIKFKEESTLKIERLERESTDMKTEIDELKADNAKLNKKIDELTANVQTFLQKVPQNTGGTQQ